MGAAKAVPVVDDFDAFWQAKKADQPQVRIRGVVVPIPMDIPLALAAQMAGATEEDEEQNKKILGELYGPDVIETWIRAGMGTREFFVVLTWSFVRGSGGTISFADAVERADEVLAAMAAQNGGGSGKAPVKAKPKAKARPAPNRASRRSASAGGSSSRTSAASTGSRRKASPA